MCHDERKYIWYGCYERREELKVKEFELQVLTVKITLDGNCNATNARDEGSRPKRRCFRLSTTPVLVHSSSHGLSPLNLGRSLSLCQ